MNVSKAQWELILSGAALLGSGGGGSLQNGRKLVEALFSTPGSMPDLCSPEELHSETWGCCVADFGAAGAFSPHQAEALEQSVQALEDFFFQEDGRFSFCYPVEIGPENLVAPWLAAKKMGINVLDADTCGRSIPQLGMSLAGALSPRGAVMGNGLHQFAALKGTSPDEMESLLRPICAGDLFGSSSALALWPLKAEELREYILPGAYSRALAVGRILAEATTPEGLVSRLNLAGIQCRLGFTGDLDHFELPLSGGFNLGKARFRGAGNEVGTALFENETMMFWSSLTPSPLCTAPHGIGFWHPKKGALTGEELQYCLGETVHCLFFQSAGQLFTGKTCDCFSKYLESQGYFGPFTGF